MRQHRYSQASWVLCLSASPRVTDCTHTHARAPRRPRRRPGAAVPRRQRCGQDNDGQRRGAPRGQEGAQPEKLLAGKLQQLAYEGGGEAAALQLQLHRSASATSFSSPVYRADICPFHCKVGPLLPWSPSTSRSAVLMPHPPALPFRLYTPGASNQLPVPGGQLGGGGCALHLQVGRARALGAHEHAWVWQGCAP